MTSDEGILATSIGPGNTVQQASLFVHEAANLRQNLRQTLESKRLRDSFHDSRNLKSLGEPPRKGRCRCSTANVFFDPRPTSEKKPGRS